MEELKPCPFCGGKAKISFKRKYERLKIITPPIEIMETDGLDFWCNAHKYVRVYYYSVKAICNKCHSRGKPITAVVENHTPYSSSKDAKIAYEPFIAKAIEVWNRRDDDG